MVRHIGRLRRAGRIDSADGFPFRPPSIASWQRCGRVPGEAGSDAVAVVFGVGKAVKEAKEEQSGAVPALERVPAFSHRWARRRRVVRLSACAALLGRSARALLGWAPASASRWSYPPSPLARRPSSASCR